MRTFTFFEHDGNASITLSTPSFEETYRHLINITKYPDDWRVEDKEGEQE